MVSRCTNRNPGIGDPEESRRTDKSPFLKSFLRFTNLSLFLSLSFSYVQTRNRVPGISSRFFQNAHVFEEIFIRGKIRYRRRRTFQFSNRGKFPATETLSGRNDIEALFARSKLFIQASLTGSRDRPTELSTRVRMVSNDSSRILLRQRWSSTLIVSLFLNLR